MRRGLIKDLANTPTQIACGWRIYGDLPRLQEPTGSIITVDLLPGTSSVDARELTPSLLIADIANGWFAERIEQDGVPEDIIHTATLTLTLHTNARGSLRIACSTIVESTLGTFDSHDHTTWSGPED